jgi:hypothetical protein
MHVSSVEIEPFSVLLNRSALSQTGGMRIMVAREWGRNRALCVTMKPSLDISVQLKSA